MANGEPRKDMDHYCIQAKRIEAMDKKLDALTGHFQVDGIIGEMSGSIKKMVAVAEVISEKAKHKEDGALPIKWLIWAILGLIAILATLFGIKMPF